MNKVIIIGRLGRDPELRTTASGTAVCNFSVATDYKSGGRESTEWHSIVAWERTAEIADQYLRKGDRCAVEGRLQTRSWEDKTHGDKRYKTEIICERLELLGKSAASGDAPPDPAPADDSDIPF